MAEHRVRVGLHARNAVRFPDRDYELVRLARIETLKTMSFTETGVYKRLRQDQPDLQFIVRLYDDRIGRNSRPSPVAFVARMAPIVKRLKPYAEKFEIHNEPNHADGIEGWGPSDNNARAFRTWYLQVLSGLKRACPWAKFGFPGLALNYPHRDLVWLEICRDAIQASDWLGCHCYWQYGNMLSEDWGLRFKLYKQRFPDKEIEITEFGDSTPNRSRHEIARLYVRYYQELSRYAYVSSASAFIASSPDPAWAPFVWMKESGEMLPVVQAVASMERKGVEVQPVPTLPGPPGPPMQDITDELLVHATNRFATRALAAVHRIVIHHTATSAAVTPQRLAEHAVRTLGRPGIGYHFVIAADGTIYQTNRLETASSHAFGHSGASVGICFPGNFTTEIPTAAQLEAGGRLCAWLLVALGVSAANILGLSELVATQSPGKQWLSGEFWKGRLLAEVDKALQANDSYSATVVARLREQIKSLLEKIEELKRQLPEVRVSPVVVRPAIRDVILRLPRHPTKTYDTRQHSDIRNVIIHHSAAPASVGPEAIARYHVRSRDWPGAGYHFMVAVDGTLYQANPLESISYHAASANATSVGVCFLGSFLQTVPPQAQLRAGAHLVAWLLGELNLSVDDVKGHKEVLETACPGDQWLEGQEWKEALRQEVMRFQKESAAQTPATKAEEGSPGTTAGGEEALASVAGSRGEGRAETANGKAIYHYLLFWGSDGGWAEQAWTSARNYVGRFRPAAGFSLHDASHAQYVTIVSGPPEGAAQAEASLRTAGCKVERIAGQDDADILRQLDELVQQGKRFQSLGE